MGLKKGQTNNPAGRPKGAKNKVGEELRETIAAFLEENFEKVKNDFKSRRLSVRDRLKFYTDLLPYAVPKLQATTLELTNFERLSEDQIDEIIERLTKAAYETDHQENEG